MYDEPLPNNGQHAPQTNGQSEGSVVMGASIISSHAGTAMNGLGWASEIDGGAADSGINGETRDQTATPKQPSYNPLASPEEDSYIAPGLERAPSLFALNNHTDNQYSQPPQPAPTEGRYFQLNLISIGCLCRKKF